MKTCLNCVIALSTLLLGSLGMASQTRVIINLSDQRVSLVQQGRITLVSPIASGKPGWSTPREATLAFSTRISTIGLGASGRSSTLTEEWSTQMQLRAAMYPEAAIINRADAARSRCPVFRASPNWNASHGRRQHGQPSSSPKGPSDFAHRFICGG
jgi:hypothetical protein